MPLSWKHYVYGLQHLGRTHLRDQLSAAQAARFALLKPDDWNAYQRDTMRMTEGS